MKTTKTQRGFLKGEFIDRYDQKCSLQESSIATEPCIWLGVDVDLNGKDVHSRMHLTQDQVKELIPKLEHFVRTGLLLISIALCSCATSALTCSDYAAGKGSHNRQYSNAYKRHFTPHTNFMKANPMPRI